MFDKCIQDVWNGLEPKNEISKFQKYVLFKFCFCSFGMFDMFIQYVLDGLKATAEKSQKNIQQYQVYRHTSISLCVFTLYWVYPQLLGLWGPPVVFTPFGLQEPLRSPRGELLLFCGARLGPCCVSVWLCGFCGLCCCLCCSVHCLCLCWKFPVCKLEVWHGTNLKRTWIHEFRVTELKIHIMIIQTYYLLA